MGHIVPTKHNKEKVVETFHGISDTLRHSIGFRQDMRNPSGRNNATLMAAAVPTAVSLMIKLVESKLLRGTK